MSANESALTATTVHSFTVLIDQSPSQMYILSLLPLKTGREAEILPAVHRIVLPSRIVVDRSVIAAGLRSQLSASDRMLTLVAERRLVPLVTTALFLNMRTFSIGRSSDWRRAWRRKTYWGYWRALACAAKPVDVHFMWRPQLADPADELELEAAVNGASALSRTLCAIARPYQSVCTT
jgi:hypothetical protein